MALNPRTLRPGSTFTPRSISGLALWLDAADTQTLYTTDAGPVTAVSSPLDISGCGLWLDASNAGSLTLNGNTVSEWRDLSGNARHFSQATSASQPNANSRTQNGRRVLDFAGAQVMLGNAASLNIGRNIGVATMFVVANSDALATGTWFLASRNGSNAQARLSLSYNLGLNNIVSGGRRTDADSFASAGYTPSGDDLSAASVHAGVCNFAGSDAFIWRNGILRASNTAFHTDGNTADTNSDSVSLGALGDGTNALDGVIAEVIVYPAALTAAQRASVESYLAAKWGISGVHAPATATSDPVGYWGDKSGNGRHMLQPSSSPRPVRNTQNNRSSLSFNGTSQWMRQERTNFQMQTALIAWRRTGTPIAFASPFAANGSVAATLGGAAYVSSDAHSLTYNVGSTGNHYWGSNIAANRATAVRSLGATQSAANFAVFTSGVTLAPNTSDVALMSAVFANSGAGNKAFFAGIEPFADTRHYPCQLLEVLLYNGVLTDAQIARIERYLASKWGVTLAPQVSNADAQDWVNRVYAAGGTVSATTATAVNTFCNDIENAGIRDRFYRLNLFCGNSDASLAAVRTPLYRGPSLGGTQYGNTIDTNAGNLFVANDYAETLASGGLIGNGSTKYLETGFSLASLPSAASRHISVYEIVKSANTNDASIGGTASASVDGMVLHTKNPATAYAWSRGGPNEAVAATGSYSGGAHWIGQNTTLRASRLYKNGSLDNSATLTSDVTSTAANTVSVFAWKITGGTPDPTWVYHSAARLGGYSIGVSMSDAQALAYYNAMQAFQTALGRQV